MKVFVFIICLSFAGISFSQSNYTDYADNTKEQILYDNFDNNNKNWWVGNLDFAWATISDGYYTCKVNSDAMYLPFNLPSIYINENSDFEIETSIKFVESANTFGNGIIWGQEKSLNRNGLLKHFFFLISPNGQICIGKYSFNWVFIMPWSANSNVKIGDFNKLTLRKTGLYYYFFINDFLLYKSPYEPFFGPDIQFQVASKTQVAFDFIKISYLPKLKENIVANNYVPPVNNVSPAKTETFKPTTIKADVDENIPENRKENPSRFALIIGNEDYSSKQKEINTEINVAFARNDALIFKEYVKKVLGVPEINIILKLDATAGEMWQGIDKINKIIKASEGSAEIFFYYAGHGLPDETTKEAYLIPVDVNGTNLNYAVKLKDVYSKLSEFPSKRVSVFLDACFSGGARSEGLIAARGVKVKPKDELLHGNIIVFTASSAEQSSLPYKEKNHGLFTYFLLKKLQDSKGDVTYKDLSDYVNKQVKLNSILINDKEQLPQTNVSSELQDNWTRWNFK